MIRQGCDILSLSSFLTHFLHFLCDFNPYCEPRCPTHRDHITHFICILASCQTSEFSRQWWSLFDLGGQPPRLLSLHTTCQYNNRSLCEITVKSHRRLLHCESFSCTFCFTATWRFAFSNSWESSQWDTVPRQINNRCSNVFFDSCLIFSIVCHFYTLQPCCTELCVELILFSKQNMM